MAISGSYSTPRFVACVRHKIGSAAKCVDADRDKDVLALNIVKHMFKNTWRRGKESWVPSCLSLGKLKRDTCHALVKLRPCRSCESLSSVIHRWKPSSSASLHLSLGEEDGGMQPPDNIQHACHWSVYFASSTSSGLTGRTQTLSFRWDVKKYESWVPFPFHVGVLQAYAQRCCYVKK